MRGSCDTKARHARSAIRSCSRASGIDNLSKMASEGHTMHRRKFLQIAGVGAASPFLNWQALAQGQTDRVLIVSEMNANSLDTHTVGANRAAYGVVWMTYDRLITFGTKTLPNGVQSYDYFSLKPQLAESWEFAPDNSAVTFKLRRDATFHDGTPGQGPGREVVLRPLREGRRFSATADGAGIALLRRPVRGGRRLHLPGEVPSLRQAHHAVARDRGAQPL